jgi:hypothetical protein
MKRTTFSFTRAFKFSKPAVDDREGLEESFRMSSFALLPTVVTPSRAPSNTLVASSQAPFFHAPVRFHVPYGQDKWPEIADWYHKHKIKGSTAIDKLQLRKDHQHPYYHEYVIVTTRGGHTYRIDRRPDAHAAFDTIMKDGCTAYDTIEEVLPTSLKDLFGISDCVVELRWRGEQCIDLLFILSICFRIRNDKWASRYTLQHYNCYFLSWIIIVIVARHTTTWEDELNTALRRDVWAEGFHDWSVMQRLGWARNMSSGQELDPDLELELDRQRMRDRRRKQELEQELEPELEAELELIRKILLERQRVRQLKEELERRREQQRKLELKWYRQLKRRQQTQEREQRRPQWQQQRECERELVVVREREQELKRELVQVEADARAQMRKRSQMLAQVLGHIPLVLGWELAQGWKHKKANVRETLRELLGVADTVSLPGELDTLTETVPDRRADWIILLSGLTNNMLLQAGWLSKGVGIVVKQMMNDPSGDLCETLSGVADFPSWLSVSLSNNVGIANYLPAPSNDNQSRASPTPNLTM